MIIDFMTCNWGKLPPTTKPYPVHDKVNAFVGRSGHGKTTIMDGIRIVLGDTTFENKRGIGYYVNKASTWAIVRIGFFNGIVKGEDSRPFEPYGLRQDKVVVCCRVFKNSEGRWQKEYYVFDGEFLDLESLAVNPKAYKQALKSQEDYRCILEDCIGLTAAYRRLMAMDPNSVRDLVDKSPANLYQQIFELKGMKDIKSRYEAAKEQQSVQKKACEILRQELSAAEKRYEELREKAKLYQEFETNKVKHAHLEIKQAKVLYHETEAEIRQLELTIAKTIQDIRAHETNLNRSIAQINQCELQLKDLQQKLETAQNEYNTASSEYDRLQKPIAQEELIFENLQEKIDHLNKITPVNIKDLEDEWVTTKEQHESANLQLADIRRNLKSVIDQLAAIEKNQFLFPGFVTQYRDCLEKAKIPFTMLADAITVKPEFKEWQTAVEAYLGRERFRVVVQQSDYLAAKKIQQDAKYGARVCLPRASRSNASSKRGHNLTIYDVIEISQADSIGGYLDGLKQISLVRTVEEGDQLQRQGHTSITIKGLLQDDDGAVFRSANGLYCGKLAMETEKTRLIEEEKKLTEAGVAKQIECQKLSDSLDIIKTWIQEQQDYLTLPAIQLQVDQMITKLTGLREQSGGFRQRRDDANKQKDSLLQQQGNIKAAKAQQEEAQKNSKEKVLEEQAKLQKTQIVLQQNNIKLTICRDALLEMGTTANEISFIPQDLSSAGFQNEAGNLLSSDEIGKQVRKIAAEMDRFRNEHSDVTEKTVQLAKLQEGHVEMQKQKLAASEQLLESAIEETQNCLFSLTRHIREAMNDYMKEFEMLADLLKANAKGRLEEPTEDPEFWQLHIYIGFDGKEPVAINGPELSQGQRACASLMLLLASVSNRRRRTATPIMFLDEPRSRLDDDRGNEIGRLLQITDVQYFITHQQGESLKAVDWINHAFTCSFCPEDQTYGSPMILKRMRTA